MFKDIRSLVKHSGIYSLGNILSRSIGIILIPVYTAALSIEQFGIYAIFEAIIFFSESILHFGLPNALFKWLNNSNFKNREKNILFTTLLFMVFISLVIILITFLLQDFIHTYFTIGYELQHCLFVSSLIIGAKLISKASLSYIRFKEKSVFFIIVNIGHFFIQLLLTIYFVLYINLGVLGILLGILCGEIFAILLQFPYWLKNICLVFEYKEIYKMFKFGFPLAFSDISARILLIGDRFILGYFLNMGIVGIYSLGYKFANLLYTIIGQAFNNSYIPFAWKKLSDSDAKRFYSVSLTYFTYTMFWTGLFIAIYAKGIIHLFAKDPSYWDAYKIIPIIILAKAIRSQFIILRMGFQFTNRTRIVAYIVSLCTILHLSLNFILIPAFSMMGAAYATFIAFTCIPVIGYYYSQKYFPVKYEWKRISMIIVVSLMLFFISSLFDSFTFVPRILFKFSIFISFPLILYLLNFYSENELLRLKDSLKKWTTLLFGSSNKQ
jgi:O-antigen/teichoic acid export membrane protein